MAPKRRLNSYSRASFSTSMIVGGRVSTLFSSGIYIYINTARMILCNQDEYGDYGLKRKNCWPRTKSFQSIQPLAGHRKNSDQIAAQAPKKKPWARHPNLATKTKNMFQGAKKWESYMHGDVVIDL